MIPQTHKIIITQGGGFDYPTLLYNQVHATGTIDMFMVRSKRSQKQPIPKCKKGSGEIRKRLEAKRRQKDAQGFLSCVGGYQEKELLLPEIDRSSTFIDMRQRRLDISLGRMSCPTLYRHHPSVRPA